MWVCPKTNVFRAMDSNLNGENCMIRRVLIHMHIKVLFVYNFIYRYTYIQGEREREREKERERENYIYIISNISYYIYGMTQKLENGLCGSGFPRCRCQVTGEEREVTVLSGGGHRDDVLLDPIGSTEDFNRKTTGEKKTHGKSHGKSHGKIHLHTDYQMERDKGQIYKTIED